MIRTFTLVLAIALTAGCANQSFTVNGNAAGSADQSKSHHFFINGIAQGKNVDAAEVCGGIDKVAKVEVQQTFVNGLFSVLTLGIYTPRSARVYCGSGV